MGEDETVGKALERPGHMNTKHGGGSPARTTLELSLRQNPSKVIAPEAASTAPARASLKDQTISRWRRFAVMSAERSSVPSIGGSAGLHQSRHESGRVAAHARRLQYAVAKHENRLTFAINWPEEDAFLRQTLLRLMASEKECSLGRRACDPRRNAGRAEPRFE